MNRVIMKFGGASVATPQHFSRIADLILARRKENQQIVTVVSAMGDTTNQLIALAKQVHPNPPTREYDMLITVGERISIALLAMALTKKNQNAVSFTGSQSGIITSSDHTEARIIDVRPHRLELSLDQGKVVIVAGFQGVSTHGEITTLGRGGSDTTAVALGIALNAVAVEFYKDVPGIFDEDPKKQPQAKHYSKMAYDAALEIAHQGAEVLHERSLMLAKRNRLPLLVKSFKEDDAFNGTLIGEVSSRRTHSPMYEDSPCLAQ